MTHTRRHKCCSLEMDRKMNFEEDRSYEQLADFIVDLISGMELVSHSKGKIDLKVPLEAYSKAVRGVDGINLSDLLAGFNGIRKYDFSLFWRTLEIQYDTSIIPGSLWENLVKVKQDPSIRGKTKESVLDILKGNSRKS